MPKYDRPGTENLGTTTKKMHADLDYTAPDGPDVGGTANLKANQKSLHGPAWKTPTGQDGHPVKAFKDASV